MASAEMASTLVSVMTQGLAKPVAAATRQSLNGAAGVPNSNDWLTTWQGTQKSVAGSPAAAVAASAAPPPAAGPAALMSPPQFQSEPASMPPVVTDFGPPSSGGAPVTTDKQPPPFAIHPIDPASSAGVQPSTCGQAPSAPGRFPVDRKHKDVATGGTDISSTDDPAQAAAAFPMAAMMANPVSAPAIMADASQPGQTDPAAAADPVARPIVAASQAPALSPLTSTPIATPSPADWSPVAIGSEGVADASIARPTGPADASGEHPQPKLPEGQVTSAATRQSGGQRKAASSRQATSASVSVALPLLARSRSQTAIQVQDSAVSLRADQPPVQSVLMDHAPAVAAIASREPAAQHVKPGAAAGLATPASAAPDQSSLFSPVSAAGASGKDVGLVQEPTAQAPAAILPSAQDTVLFPSILQSIRPAAPGLSSEPAAIAQPVAQTDAGNPDVARQIMNAMVSGGSSNQLVVKLNPESLGPLQIEVARSSSGTVDVRITVEQPHALHLLMQDLAGVHNALDQGGVASEGRTLSVQIGAPTDSSTGHAAATSAPIMFPTGEHAASGWTQPDVPDARSASSHTAHQQMSGGQSEAGRNFGGQNFGEASGGYRHRPWSTDEFAPTATAGASDPLTLGIDITA